MDEPRALTVTLPPDVADLVRASVASGRFATPEEAVAAALRHEADERAATLEEIKRRIRESEEDPRPRVPLEEFSARMEEMIQRRRSEAPVERRRRKG